MLYGSDSRHVPKPPSSSKSGIIEIACTNLEVIFVFVYERLASECVEHVAGLDRWKDR